MFFNSSELFEVQLNKSSSGFGFGIRGGKEFNLPLYILRVQVDGPAFKSGIHVCCVYISKLINIC